jgi:hypothetical protein
MIKEKTASIKAPSQSGVVRKSNFGLNVIAVGTSIVAGLFFLLPPVASAITHGVDRATNGIKAKRELKARMKFYAPQIAQTLGIDPNKVTLSDFKQAAAINPVLASAVKDVKREEAKENKTSAMINGATALIPGGRLVADAALGAKVLAGAVTLGKQAAVVVGSGLLVDWTTKERIKAQEVIEGISSQLSVAHEQGLDPRKVVTPQMVFLLRISQDDVLAAQIKERYKKPFQKMNAMEQEAVMLDYKPLADAVTSEAYAVAQGILPVQELMARAPNLKSNADKYAVGSANSSFVSNELSRRAAAAQMQPSLNN